MSAPIPAWHMDGARVVAAGGARYATHTDAKARTVGYLAADWLIEEGWATRGPCPWDPALVWLTPTPALRDRFREAA